MNNPTVRTHPIQNRTTNWHLQIQNRFKGDKRARKHGTNFIFSRKLRTKVNRRSEEGSEKLRNHVKIQKSNRMNGGSGAPNFSVKKPQKKLEPHREQHSNVYSDIAILIFEKKIRPISGKQADDSGIQNRPCDNDFSNFFHQWNRLPGIRIGVLVCWSSRPFELWV